MAERVTDLKDIRDRVVAELNGLPEPGVPVPDVPSILCAEDLAPADTAGLDPALILGLATTLGGPTSHTAIIARQLGIPCVVAVAGLGRRRRGHDGARRRHPRHRHGDAGSAPRPPPRSTRRAAPSRRWPTGPAPVRPPTATRSRSWPTSRTAPPPAPRSETPAEGVGLFRTELCFLDRETEPTVDEQAEIYGEVLQAFSGRKVVVRTLDAGSDKPLKFAGHPDEANPALGVRGIRIAIGNPGLMERQLAAIAEAAEQTGTSPWVMAPMVATAEEAKVFAAQVRAHGLTPGRDDRGTGCGSAGRPHPRARRLPVDRHQRPRAVHDGR